MTTDNIDKRNLCVTDIVFERFMKKIQEDEKLDLSEKTIVADIKKITSELMTDEGKYKSYIEDSLMYFGYRLREDNRNQEQSFQAHIQQEYGFIFYHMDLIYLLSIELGEFIFDKISSNNTVNYLFKLKHIRACSIFAEILHLLKGGYGTGAMTRYRSLHELAVVSEFVHNNGQAAAEAYLDYTEVMKAKDARYLLTLYGNDIELIKAISRFEQDVKPNLEEKYGEKFVDIKSFHDFEWARTFLNMKPHRNPTFNQIRNKINRDKGREQYKLSSNNIHSAPKSLISTLGSWNGFPIAGASNVGIAEPGSWAVYELQQMNTILMKLTQETEETNVLDSLQAILIVKLIQNLCNFVYVEFGSVERALLQEEQSAEE